MHLTAYKQPAHQKNYVSKHAIPARQARRMASGDRVEDVPLLPAEGALRRRLIDS